MAMNFNFAIMEYTCVPDVIASFHLRLVHVSVLMPLAHFYLPFPGDLVNALHVNYSHLLVLGDNVLTYF